MDMNEYCLASLVRDRQRELRAEATAAALRTAARPATLLRVMVGRALIRLGTRLQAGVAPVRATA